MKPANTLLALTFFPSVFSLICETCDGFTCYNPNQWVAERCPPETKYCYRLVNINEDKVFRRGCSTSDCYEIDEILKVKISCNICDSDRCNGLHLHQNMGPGGGVVWSRSIEKISIFMAIIISAAITVLIC